MATGSGSEPQRQLALVRQMCRTGGTAYGVIGPERRVSGATVVFCEEVGLPAGTDPEGCSLEEVFGPLAGAVHEALDRHADDAGFWTEEQVVVTPAGLSRRLQLSRAVLGDDDFYALSFRLLPLGPGDPPDHGLPVPPPGPSLALAFLDDDLVVVAEDGAAALLGGDAVGSPWIALVHPDDQPAEILRIAGAEEPRRWSGTVRLGAAGTWVQVVAQPVEGAVPAVLARAGAAVGATTVVAATVVDHWVANRDAVVELAAPLMAMADELPVALVELAPDGRVVVGNRALVDLLGWDPTGRWVAEFIPPEHLARVFGVVAAALGADESFVTEFPVTRADGSLRWVRATGHSRTRDDGEWASVAGTWTDITGEREVRSQAERFMEVLDSVDDLIAITDGAGSIVYLNGTGREMLGGDDAEPVPGSLPVFRLLAAMEPSETGAFLTDVAATIARQDVWTGEVPFGRAEDPRTYSVAISRHISDVDGRHSMIVVARDITPLKEAEAVLRDRASRDSLTGLANRATFLEALGEELRSRRAAASREPLAVLFVDLDRFKPVNDAHGHAVGDEVLAVAGARLGGSTREGDLIARFGGDEFVVLCRSVDDELDAVAVAERMIGELSRPVVLGAGPVITVGASVGVALSDPDDEADQLIARADRALRAAKAAGRGRAVLGT